MRDASLRYIIIYKCSTRTKETVDIGRTIQVGVKALADVILATLALAAKDDNDLRHSILILYYDKD